MLCPNSTYIFRPVSQKYRTNQTEVVDCPVENQLVDNSSAQLGTEEAKQKTFDVTNAMKYFSHGIV